AIGFHDAGKMVHQPGVGSLVVGLQALLGGPGAEVELEHEALVLELAERCAVHSGVFLQVGAVVADERLAAEYPECAKRHHGHPAGAHQNLRVTLAATEPGAQLSPTCAPAGRGAVDSLPVSHITTPPTAVTPPTASRIFVVVVSRSSLSISESRRLGQ